MKLSIRLKFCADCDGLFDIGYDCPHCGSHSTDFVSRWIPPMFWKRGGIDDTVKLTIRDSKVQEDIPRVHLDTPVVSDNYGQLALERELNLVQSLQAQSFNAGYECGKEAGPRSEARKVDSLSGKLVEKLLSIIKECYRPHAGSLPNLETPVDKGTVKGSGDKFDSWYKDPKNVHERELNFD